MGLFEPDSLSEDRLQNSVLQYTEIKIQYSPSILRHNKGQMKNALLLNNITRTGYTCIYKYTLFRSMDPIFASYGTHAMNYFVFGDFYVSGMQDG